MRLHVAGLQPVVLQDRRVENVDLSSVVSTPGPLGPTLGGGEGAHLTPTQRPMCQGHAPARSTPDERIVRTHWGTSKSCSRAPSLCQGNAPRPLAHVLSNLHMVSGPVIIIPIPQIRKQA